MQLAQMKWLEGRALDAMLWRNSGKFSGSDLVELRRVLMFWLAEASTYLKQAR
jgi:hypothetical protein